MNFTVWEEPFGKERPRFSTVNKFVMTYTAPDTRAYERKIKLWFMKLYSRKDIIPRRFSMNVDIFYQVPKSYSIKKKELCYSQQVRPHLKPDEDNVKKIVMDALNKLAYCDDSKSIGGYVWKWWAQENEKPRIEITIAKENDFADFGLKD